MSSGGRCDGPLKTLSGCMKALIWMDVGAVYVRCRFCPAAFGLYACCKGDANVMCRGLYLGCGRIGGMSIAIGM